MSPAGLLGIARDAGTTLVLVLGSGVGDIFRRNALNLGLEVLECPAAAEDARDEHRFTFDPATRQLVNDSLGRSYDPTPLTAREAELRRSGGILAAGRREFPRFGRDRAADRVARAARKRPPHRNRADPLGPSGGPPGRGLGGREHPGNGGPAARFGRHGAFRDSTPSGRSPGAPSIPGRPRSRTTTSSSPGARRTNGRRRSAGGSPKPRVSRRPGSRRRETASSTSTFPSRGSCCPAP